MAAKAKYLFDQDFAAGAKPGEKPIAPSEHAVLLGEAESKGFREGFAAAENEGQAVAARRTAAAFEQIGDGLDRLARGVTEIERRIEADAIEVACAIGRKLAPELILRQPFAEIAALATECLKQLAHAPHLVVRVNDSLHETAKSELAQIARTRGFEGRLVVVAEPAIAVGDCKIEWADGGVIRDIAKTEAAIGGAIDRYLGVRRNAALPELGDITARNEP